MSDPVNDARIDVVLRFWFGSIPSASFPFWQRLKTLSCVPYWNGRTFNRLFAVDSRLKRLFEQDAADAADGRRADWMQSPTGRLALILLFDQFPRNIYRGTERAFSLDAQGYALARRCLQEKDDQIFHPLVRSFYYLTLVHVENLDVQNEAVELYRRALSSARDSLSKTLLRAQLDGAIRHQEIIHRFGRFPHRNCVLNRVSTHDELYFLQQPHSSF